MNITPVIPDGFNGPIKQLTCRICKHIFYLNTADYDGLQEVLDRHECSPILKRSLEKHQVAQSIIPPKQTPIPTSPPLKHVLATVLQSPEPLSLTHFVRSAKRRELKVEATVNERGVSKHSSSRRTFTTDASKLLWKQWQKPGQAVGG
jgi:hypothetical protein